uniref:Ig-like domain-containing protein n=1 Tax=Cyprinus carpio TaxID=7962 RepID=A0A8C1NGJ2_CYPCA
SSVPAELNTSHLSLSLSCEDQSNSTGWTVRRYTGKYGLENCSSSVSGSQTGSSCTIRKTSTEDTGVYWCESESGEKHHPVNITVHSGVILESPVSPVTEGEPLTLRCLYKNTTSPNLRADFYKDGSLIQNQTTEMIISTVSKSDEGFYSCKHPERGELPKSWISVTGESQSNCELVYFFSCSRSDMVLDKVLVCLFFSVSFRISDLCPPHTQFCTGSLSISARDSRADFQMLQDER